MIKNFFTVALRNMMKHKFFAFINLLGLTIGIAGCLFIALYISDELSYEKFIPNSERIYRLNLHGRIAGQEIYTTSTNSQLARTLMAEMPEVEQATRIFQFDEWVVRNGDLIFTEEEIYAADSNFFRVFEHEFIEGTMENALVGPHKIVMTESMADKYFPNESALDKIVTMGNDKTEYLVTGVIKDIPRNTHIPINALISMRSFDWMFPQQGQWLSNSFQSYYRISENGIADNVDSKLKPIVDRNVSPIMKEFMGKTLEELEADGAIYQYFSIPLERIHLYSDLQDEPTPVGDIMYVYIMAAIGLFILLIAAINFMNLSTAKYAGRAKEVGLRKTMGSLRNALIGQFISESVLYCVISMVFAFALVSALMSNFNTLSGKELTIFSLFTPEMGLIILFITLVLGVMAGSYPAFYLTSFDIAETLKGKLKGAKGGKVRSFLVTFQFAISIILIICTGVVYQQIKFMQNENLGFDKDQVMIVSNVGLLEDNREAFKNEFMAKSYVENVSFSNNELPGVNNTTIFRQEGSDSDHILGTFYADNEFASTLGIEMASGRFFSEEFPSDTLACVLNEAAVKEFGWEDDPTTHKVFSFDGDEPVALQVVGVMKDFNFETIKTPIRPLLLQHTDISRTMYVRFSGQTNELISEVETNWMELAPEEPAQYSFMDQEFDNLFREEQRLGSVFTAFTMIAIAIACLGLFGLASFMAEQRTKEIGVRKVMGASVWSITNQMSFEFIKLVALAFILAVFPAYYFMSQWLGDFPVRIDIGVGIFLVAGALSIIIAWLTVGLQSYRAASTNPIRSLRYE